MSEEVRSTPYTAGGAECVGEVLLPTRNERDVLAAHLLIGALPLPISLEYLGTEEARRMLVRGSRTDLQAVASLLEGSYPSARLALLDHDPLDAVQGSAPGVQYRAVLARPPYFPLRTWQSYLDGDPVTHLLAHLAPLAGGEALWLQFDIRTPTRPAWLSAVQRRIKIERQRGFLTAPSLRAGEWVERAQGLSAGALLNGFFSLAILVLALAVVGLFLGRNGLLSGLLLALALLSGLVWSRMGHTDEDWEAADLEVVAEKVIHPDGLLEVVIRAGIYSPELARAPALAQRVVSVLAQFDRVGGNRLTLEPWAPGAPEKHVVLSRDELAALWHLPRVVDAPAPLLSPVNTFQRRVPHPQDRRGAFPIGETQRPDGSWTPVSIGERALQTSMALFGKPGQGKSNLMMHLALAAVQSTQRPCVVVVDPHGELAEALIGMLPETALERVRVLDVMNREYLLTFNPLEMHRQGLSVEGVAQLMVDIGRELWEDYWGPRMQIPLSRAVQALAAANTFHAADDQLGLALLGKFLGGSHELRRHFIESELGSDRAYRDIRDYFEGEFRALSYPMREQIIQPVLSKAQRFHEDPLLPLLSCPRATLDLGSLIASRQILIVNTRLSSIGPEMSDFVGSLLLNLLMRAIARQGECTPEERSAVRVLVDEFQTFTGVGWGAWEQQLRKWGGSVILGTQSLASLRASQGAELPGIITSGTGALFAFATNGEDAEYLARYELSESAGGPSADTLTHLPPFHCYARLLREDGSPTAPFSLRTAAPPAFRAAMAREVHEAREHYSVPYGEALRLATEQLQYLDRYQAEAQLASTGSDVPHTRAVAGAETVGGAPSTERPAAASPRSAAPEVPPDDQTLADRVAEDLLAHFGEDFDPFAHPASAPDEEPTRGENEDGSPH